MIRAQVLGGEHRRGSQENWGEKQLRSEELLPGGEGSRAGGVVAVLSGAADGCRGRQGCQQEPQTWLAGSL